MKWSLVQVCVEINAAWSVCCLYLLQPLLETGGDGTFKVFLVKIKSKLIDLIDFWTWSWNLEVESAWITLLVLHLSFQGAFKLRSRANRVPLCDAWPGDLAGISTIKRWRGAKGEPLPNHLYYVLLNQLIKAPSHAESSLLGQSNINFWFTWACLSLHL